MTITTVIPSHAYQKYPQNSSIITHSLHHITRSAVIIQHTRAFKLITHPLPQLLPNIIGLAKGAACERQHLSHVITTVSAIGLECGDYIVNGMTTSFALPTSPKTVFPLGPTGWNHWLSPAGSKVRNWIDYPSLTFQPHPIPLAGMLHILMANTAPAPLGTEPQSPLRATVATHRLDSHRGRKYDTFLIPPQRYTLRRCEP